jgi:hypothetical protein
VFYKKFWCRFAKFSSVRARPVSPAILIMNRADVSTVDNSLTCCGIRHKTILAVTSVRGILNSWDYRPGLGKSINAGFQCKQMLCHYILRGPRRKQRLIVRTSADSRTNMRPRSCRSLSIHLSCLPTTFAPLHG